MAPYTEAKQRRLFESRVDRSGGPGACHPWTAGIHKRSTGYGIMQWRGRPTLAHRIAFEVEHGRPPAGHVCHRCDNPPCCNPAHLYEGDDASNMADRDTRGRGGQHKRRGAANGQAVLTEEVVRAIKRRRSAGESYGTIARALGQPKHRVAQVASGKTWGHVTL